MLACRKLGDLGRRSILPEHPIPVLILRANELRFGARSAAAFIAIVALMVAMALFVSKHLVPLKKREIVKGLGRLTRSTLRAKKIQNNLKRDRQRHVGHG
jgi:hypothetical protein